MAGDLARADQAYNTRKYIATREISTCRRGEKSAEFTICYVNVHAAIAQSTRTELARGPWFTGGVWRVMTVRPISIIVRNNEERVLGSETMPFVSCHMTCKPLQADSPES